MLDVITIQLSKGRTGILDSVDSDLAQLKWHSHESARTYYAIRRSSKITSYLHRIILSRIIGRDLMKGEYVDHINGDGWDNRRCNLRLVTHAQNCRNQRLQSRSASGYKGVSFYKRDQNWSAHIKLNGKKRHLGYFQTPEAAHEAYLKAASELFGEFSRSG